MRPCYVKLPCTICIIILLIMTLASKAARKSNSKGQRQRKSTYKGTKKGSRSKRGGPFESRYVSRNVNFAIKQLIVTLSRDKQLNAHLFSICILFFSL